ncbi:MAG: hypothetical protein ACI976_002198 [Aureispira sp.]
MLKMRSVAGYTPDSLVEFGAKKLFKCSSYFFTVPKALYFKKSTLLENSNKVLFIFFIEVPFNYISS